MSVEAVSPETLRKKEVDLASLFLIDVRTPGEYERMHAQGARSIPLDHLDAGELSLQRASGEQAIYVICQSGARSAKACEKLSAAGVAPVYSISGGTAAWHAAGFPVTRSSRGTISLERQVRIVAGGLVVSGFLLAWAVNLKFLTLPLLVGVGLVFAGITDFCGMGLLIAKMPWNRGNRDPRI